MPRAVIVGAARSGLAVAAHLVREGREVLVTDAKAQPSPDILNQLRALGVPAVWGDHPQVLLEDCAEVVVSPGVPWSIPFLEQARHRAIPVTGELELAHRILRTRDSRAQVLAVTGTNGKSTTTDLLGHLLRASALPARACGNLGTPFIEAIQDAAPGTRFAVECSSYQLESVAQFHAEAAVCLNLTPDHLARHGSMEAYLAAKLKIFAGQTPADLRLLPATWEGEDEVPGQGRTARFGWGAPDRTGAWCDEEGMLWLREEGQGPERLLHRRALRIPGDHNVENALAAAALARHGGASFEGLREGLRTYPGLAHRIAFCGERQGIRAYNDSKGTNVDATATALKALPGPLVLMLGGQDKGASYGPLRPLLEGKLRHLIFYGEAIPQLERELGDLPHRTVPAFDDATAAALEAAQPGDQVLLSPACASFDQFLNFEERGHRFEALVKTWTQS